MMDSDGRVVEGTQTNFFALHVRSCAVGCAFVGTFPTHVLAGWGSGDR